MGQGDEPRSLRPRLIRGDDTIVPGSVQCQRSGTSARACIVLACAVDNDNSMSSVTCACAGAVVRAIDLAFEHFAQFGWDDGIIAVIAEAVEHPEVAERARHRFAELSASHR